MVAMTVDAKAYQLADRVECVAWTEAGGAVYAVPSLSDPEDFHVVTDLGRLGLGQGLRCDCVAGVHRQTCGHAAAVALARERHAARRLREPEAGR